MATVKQQADTSGSDTGTSDQQITDAAAGTGLTTDQIVAAIAGAGAGGNVTHPVPLGGVPYYAPDPKNPGQFKLDPQTKQPIRWTATRTDIQPVISRFGGEAAGVVRPVTTQVLPQYYKGKAEELIAGMQPEDIDTLQKMMVSLHLYSSAKPNIVYRVADDKTVAAFEKVLGAANASGMDYKDQLKFWLTNGAPEFQPPTVANPSVVTLPNPIDLRQTFQGVAQQLLGKNLPDNVVKGMVDSYNAQLQSASAASDVAQAQSQNLVPDAQGNMPAGPNFTQAPSQAGYAEEQIRQDFAPDVAANDMLTQLNNFKSILGAPFSHSGGLSAPGGK